MSALPGSGPGQSAHGHEEHRAGRWRSSGGARLHRIDRHSARAPRDSMSVRPAPGRALRRGHAVPAARSRTHAMHARRTLNSAPMILLLVLVRSCGSPSSSSRNMSARWDGISKRLPHVLQTRSSSTRIRWSFDLPNRTGRARWRRTESGPLGAAQPFDGIVVGPTAARTLEASRTLLRLLGEKLSFVHARSAHTDRLDMAPGLRLRAFGFGVRDLEVEPPRAHCQKPEPTDSPHGRHRPPTAIGIAGPPLRRTVALPLTLQPLAVNRPVSIRNGEPRARCGSSSLPRVAEKRG